MKYLNSDQLARFHQDGFLVVDGFLSATETQRVETGIARVAAGVSDMVRDRGGFNLEKVGDDSFNPQAAPKRPGMLRKIQGAVFEVQEVREVFTGARMLDCMEDLMGPELWYHSSKVMFKPARGGAAKPWHQDAAYWTQYASNQITVWIAIHDATVENGCVWAIPGSHKLGLVPHHEVERQVREHEIDLGRAQPVPVKPGGLLIFHSLVLHKSDRNTSDKDRWCIICDYDSQANATIDDASGHAGRLPGLRADGVWQLRGRSLAPVG